MPLSQDEKEKLNILFAQVGFEGEKQQAPEMKIKEPPSNNSSDPMSYAPDSSPDPIVDQDILDLLDDPAPQITELSPVDSEDEEFGFLDEPDKKQSRFQSKSKQEEDNLPPVESHTLPKNIIFNLGLNVDQLSDLLEQMGEESAHSHTNEGSSYLDEQEKKNSRLMSRVKKQEESQEAPVTSRTLPDSLSFNRNLPKDQLINLLKDLGEVIKESQISSDAFLEEQKTTSKLTSRVKQAKTEELQLVENHILPKSLKFNTNLSDKRIKDICKGLGEN